MQPTRSSFALATFADALARANAGIEGVTKQSSLTLLVRALWSPSFYLGPEPGMVEGGWVPMAVSSPLPGVAAGEHAISVADILVCLKSVEGYPHSAVILRDLIAKMPNVSSQEREFIRSHLRAADWSDYPPAGQQVLGRVILPFRHLPALCRTYALVEPLVLTRRLGSNQDILAPERPRVGRPSKTDAIVEKFRRRVEEGVADREPIREAAWLRAWEVDRRKAEGLPIDDNILPRVESIRNKLIKLYDFDGGALR